MTEKLYLEDPYTVEFTANIIKTFPFKQGFGIVLDKTYFHPEGGGQPNDQGTLNNLPILGLVETDNGDIIHIVESKLSDVAFGKVDWDTRLDYMQQHTGQHILSQAVLRISHAPTVGWRLTNPYPNIDIECTDLSIDDIRAIENLANRIIFENRDVKAYYIKDQDLINKLPLRKQPDARYIGERGIRIVEVSEFEYIPCGGTHCSKTGEVGLITIRDWNRKGDYWHMEFSCGGRVLADYHQKRITLRTLRNVLGAPEEQLSEKAKDVLMEMERLKIAVEDSQRLMIDYEANDLRSNAPVQGNRRISLVKKIFESGDIHRLKNLALKIVSNSNCFVVFGLEDINSSIIISRSENLAFDVSSLIKKICTEYGGRGGGGQKFAQAGGFMKSKLAEAVDYIEKEISLFADDISDAH